MVDVQHDDELERLRQRPSERFAGSEHLFDLGAEAAKLRAEPSPARDGHRQISLYRKEGMTLVLFDFEAGGLLRDHAADGYVTVHVISGAIEMTTVDRTYSMPAGSLLVLQPRVRHDVRAVEASQMLLSVRLDPAEDDRE
jgi:quercetin dioxygenase-like cupin family protein